MAEAAQALRASTGALARTLPRMTLTMDKQHARKPLPAADRRSGADRRRTDASLPEKHDRRRGLEPRKPEVVEIEMSPSEWAALSDLPPPAPKK